MASSAESKVPIEWERIDDELHRLKIGEIFHLSDSTTSMICTNFSQQFEYFTEFSLHIQEHYVRGDIVPFIKIKKEGSVHLLDSESEADDNEVVATVLELSDDDKEEEEKEVDGTDEVGVPQDNHPEPLLPELNCEVIENEDFDDFTFDAPASPDWSGDDNDFNVDSHSIFGCDSKADIKQPEENPPQPQQQQMQLIDGTDYDKCSDKFKCLTCDHESAEWDQMKEHLNTHMEPNKFQCPICSRVFSSVAYTRTHCSQVHHIRVSAKKIKESQASAMPVDLSTLEEPKEPKILYKEGVDYEKVDKKFQCITCRRVIAKFEHMKDHLLIHNSERNVHCPFCPQTFIAESYVRKHVNRAHKQRITAEEIRAAQPTKLENTTMEKEGPSTAVKMIEPKQQQQPIADPERKFVEGEDYEKSNGRYKCLTCGREILDHIKEHLMTHSNERNVYCPLCQKAFIAVSYVRKHVNRTHKQKITAEEIKRAQATIDTSKKQRNAKEDTRTLRKTTKAAAKAKPAQKSFECFQCHRQFSSFRTLCTHLILHRKALKKATVNTAEVQKNFECFDCHGLFSTLNTLRTHLKLHTGNKYPCENCGKRFAKQCYLRNHITVVHKNKPKAPQIKVLANRQPNVIASFKCKQCRTTLDTKQALREHTKTHANGPFLCVICGAVYKFKVNLKYHMDMHQAGPNNRAKCLDPTCQKTFPIKRYMMNHYRTIHLQKGKLKEAIE